MVDNFLSLSFSLCEEVKADFGPHGLSGTVCFKGQSEDAASSVAVEITLVSGHGQPCNFSTLVGGMW